MAFKRHCRRFHENPFTLREFRVQEEIIHGQPLLQILSLLENLTQGFNDGRIVISRQSTVGKGSIKYLLLNPAATLSDIVSKSRCLILAGGTMQPVSEFKDRLFFACGAPETRILEFACNHVIPPENILTIICNKGPTKKPLDFSYQSRCSNEMLHELGRILKNVCSLVPDGIVCFFPSYEYEETVHEFFTKHGILTALSNKKKIFREPKKSSQVDAVLLDYSKTITASKQGAIMFSVVGGKLSEGLNFSDQLGRCVVVVGMPYPNIKSPELKEKLEYLNKNISPQAGKEHYENMCMKAINQSIGRAVRHRADYSTVLLLDQRYSKQSVQNLLPGWIKASIRNEPEFNKIPQKLVKFFKYHSGCQVGTDW